MADWRRASGAYPSESFSDSAAVWPWVSGSWVASSAAVGLPLIDVAVALQQLLQVAGGPRS